MPTNAQHAVKADRNLAMLRDIDIAAHPEWAATVAFYRAVHLVDRLAALNPGRSLHPDNHSAREQFVRSKHKTISADFNALHDAADLARYAATEDFAAAYPGTTVEDVLIEKRLRKIESYVSQMLGVDVGSRTPPKPPAPPSE
jgi:hypothetical protein